MASAFILVTFALTHLAAVISPGPSFIVALRVSLAGSIRAGLASAFGMGIGTLIWALAAWFGLSALFAIAPFLFTVMKLAGALYLFYLAVMLWRHARQPVDLDMALHETPRSAQAAVLRAFRIGLLTQLSNPKVAVFFGSIFVAILPPDPSAATLVAVFAIVFLNEFLWYALVSALFAAKRVRARYIGFKPLIDRLTGTFLAALGVRLMAS